MLVCLQISVVTPVDTQTDELTWPNLWGTTQNCTCAELHSRVGVKSSQLGFSVLVCPFSDSDCGFA